MMRNQITEKNEKLIFSVIIPMYNCEKYITKCLISILKQEYKNYELILVNDGSTDSTLSVCKKLLINEPRVKIINKKHEGLVKAREAGIKNASGQYVIYVDADDWIVCDHFQTNAEIIKNYEPDMIIFNANSYNKNEKNSKYNNLRLPSSKNFSTGFYNKSQLNKKVYTYIKHFYWMNITSWRCVYKLNLLKKHYCKESKIVRGEDWAYTYECLWNSDSAFFLDKVLYIYNKSGEQSMMSKNFYCLPEIKLLYSYILNNSLKNNLSLTKVALNSLRYDLYNCLSKLLFNKYYQEAFFQKYSFSKDMNISFWNIFKLLRKIEDLHLGLFLKTYKLKGTTIFSDLMFYKWLKQDKYFIPLIYVSLQNKYKKWLKTN